MPALVTATNGSVNGFSTAWTKVRSTHGVSILLRLSRASWRRSLALAAARSRLNSYMPWMSRSAGSTAELSRTVTISACGRWTVRVRVAASHTGATVMPAGVTGAAAGPDVTTTRIGWRSHHAPVSVGQSTRR